MHNKVYILIHELNTLFMPKKLLNKNKNKSFKVMKKS